MFDILPYALTPLLYAALALHFWRTRWLPRAAADGAPEMQANPGIAAWERIAILAPLALHSWLLYAGLFAAPELRFGFSQALSVMMWLAVLIYWIESLIYNLGGMHALALALAAVCASLPAIFPGLPSAPYTHSFEFRSHLLLAMLAYSLFAIAALHAALMALLERRLHGSTLAEPGAGVFAGPLASLPPLLTMEALLFRLLTLGFLLLTLTLASGFVFSEELFGKAMKFNHKTVFAIISWLIFATLLAGRYVYGWRGRKALRWTIAGFTSLLLAYVGSRFVLEVLLSRPLS